MKGGKDGRRECRSKRRDRNVKVGGLKWRNLENHEGFDTCAMECWIVVAVAIAVAVVAVVVVAWRNTK